MILLHEPFIPCAILFLDFIIIAVVTLCYLFAPSSILKEKNEYVKFSLIFLSLYFALFAIIRNILYFANDYTREKANQQITIFLFCLFFLISLYLFYRFYPFKKVKRNQNVSFILFFLGIVPPGILAIMWILDLSSTM
jgi:hypothetical protein